MFSNINHIIYIQKSDIPIFSFFNLSLIDSNFSKSFKLILSCNILYNILFKRLKCEQYADGKLNDRKLKVCSGGEKRMVSILRAFSRYNSDLYILDEPINNLDAKHARILNNYIKELKEQGKAILIITHCRMFQNVDRSYAIMKKGIYELNGENSYKPQSCYGNCDNGCYEED